MLLFGSKTHLSDGIRLYLGKLPSVKCLPAQASKKLDFSLYSVPLPVLALLPLPTLPTCAATPAPGPAAGAGAAGAGMAGAGAAGAKVGGTSGESFGLR